MNPLDPASFSGTPAHMIRALGEQGIQINAVGPMREPFGLWYTAKHAFYKLVLGKSYARDREPAVLKSYARQAQREIAGSDIVMSRGSEAIAYLDCKQPIVLWTDATFASMVGFYWKNLASESVRKGMAMEQAALDRCRLAIFSSQWAADSAVRDFKVDPAKVHVVEYGGNFGEGAEPTEAEVRQGLANRASGRCDLLFVGVDWKRKGGDFAIEVASELNRIGVPTTLTLVGSGPADVTSLPAFVRPLGFVNKTTSDGRQRMASLLANSHFLILPARAEACARVLPEANAYGLPCATTNVGGIPTAIRDGINGFTFDPGATAAQWAQRIRQSLADEQGYRAMCEHSRGEYLARMNWHIAGQRVHELLRSIVDEPLTTQATPQARREGVRGWSADDSRTKPIPH